AKDKRAEKAVNEAAKTGSKMPIIKETIKSTGETIGNLFGQGVGSTIEGAAGFVRDIGENEKGSVAARLADYGKNLREEYESSASTYQKDLQAGKNGKGSQLAAGAIQSIPAMAFPFGAAKGVAAIASKIPAIAGKSAYIGMGAGVAAGHTQNYGEVRRSATQNLERDFPTWEKLQGNPLFEQNFNKYLDSGVSIDKARQQAHAETLDTLSEEAANKYGGMMTAIDFIAPSGAVLGSGILKNAPTSKIGKTLVGGGVDSALVKREMNQVPRTGMAKLIPDVSLPANKAAAKMVGKQALEEGLQGGIGNYGGQAASANIGGQAVDWGEVAQSGIEEALIGGVMGGGMQSATGGSPTAQAKDAAKQLRNQTNQLRQEEAKARKELAEAMQLNDPAAVQSAQSNLDNIGAEAVKVKSAYDQYGIDTPYFVERFAAQYQPKQQAEQQVDPEVPPTPETEQPPVQQALPAPKLTNIITPDTTTIIKDAVSKGNLSEEEAQQIESNPMRSEVFRLAASGEVDAAFNIVENSLALGRIENDYAQALMQDIPRYRDVQKKPTVSSIVNNHVKQQIQSGTDDLFANATELHPDTLEPLQGAESGITNFGYQPDPQQGIIAEDPNLSDYEEGPGSIDSLSTENPPEVLEPVQPLPADPVQPVSKQPDLNKPKAFTNYIRANDYLKSNGLQDSHEIVKGEDGIATVQPKSPAPEADVNSDEAFDDLLNAVPPIGTPAQNPVEPVQAADPATDFDSDEAFDEVLNAVPPSKEAAAPAEPVQPTTSFADQIREAHLNNPNTKPQLIEDEIAKGRSRADVLKEVGDIVKNIGKAPQPVTPVPEPEATAPEVVTPAQPEPVEPTFEEKKESQKQEYLQKVRDAYAKDPASVNEVIDKEVPMIGTSIDSLLNIAEAKGVVANLGKQQNPEIEQKKDKNGIQENDAPEGMKSGDIGRGSDGKPFLSKNAANRGLKLRDVESTHEVVEISPSNFVLRQKDQTENDILIPAISGTTPDQGSENQFQKYDDLAKQYGRSVNSDGAILKGNGQDTNVRISEKKGRLRIEDTTGKTLFTGATNPESLGKFLEDYWYDTKSKQKPKPEPTIQEAPTTQEEPIQPEQNQEKAKDPLSFPLAKVKEAYGHAHLSPGNTAKSFKESFDKFIQAEIDEAQPLATTDEQKAALNEAIDWVKDNYINKALPPLLNAASATVSSARAGRNNFNSKQANQRGSALDKATDQFNAELERLKGYAKLKVLAARTPKQKQADAEAAAKAEQEKLEAEQAKREVKIKAEQEAKANKKRASNANLGNPEGAEQMTAAEWRAKHKDSKSVIDGVRYVMKLVNGATSLVPVWITDEKGTAASTSKDPLQVGNTLTFSQDFDYATANKPYTIITSSKAKLTIEHEGGRLSIDRKILDIESAKNPDLYQVEVNQPAPKTKEETPAANSYESVRQSFDDVVSRLDDGDESLTLDDVKAAYNALMDNHDSLVADLSKQTKSQLLEKMHPYYAAMYKSYKKDELVNKWVNNIYRGMDFGSNGVVTISYGDKRTMAEIVRDKIEAATQEDLNKYLEERRQAVAERQKELEAAEAGMNDPKTLDDFRRINAKGDFKNFKEFYRSLTVPQQALYDELRSAETNEARMQEIERNKAYREASRPSQAIESTTEATLFAGKHTKKGTDIWTVALNGRVDGDAFNDYRSQAKGLGGYYSSYKGGGAVPGFIFDNEAAANEFLNLVTGDHEANSSDPEPEAIAIDPEAEVEVIETDAKRQADKLREKAQVIIERGEQNINRERKTNTAKRAGEAARAEEQANKAIFLGETLNRIADGIENGSVKYLARLGAMTQLSHLESLLQRASYDQQRETNSKEREINATTIAYTEYPQYKTWIDSFKDIRRELKEANPRLAEKLEKAIDTRYHNAYIRWLNETNEFGTENYVGQLARKTDGTPAVFKTNIKQAETLVKASNKRTGKDSFEVFKIKNGEYAVISSYATAIENGSWKPTNSDKQMTLTNEFGHELYDALKKYKRKNPSYYMNWFIESMHESVSRMEKLGIHDPATFRAAMREYLGLRSKEKGNDPIKELERSMIGRSNDGLDFFPTPRNVVEQMIEMADLDSDMKVLEPSAGMGHIADVLKDHGIQPDVIELSGKRQELLKLKGYSVVGNDFLMFDPKNRAPNYGDVFKTADGKYQGIMRGSGSLGSNRVRLMREDNGQMITYFDREELELVKMNGVNYDRIIMNPPFSDRRDAAHIYHAFDLLADD
ncbi:hypothetical protein KTJ53_15805, partial [Acinetobacter variabilis]|uniref:type IV pilus assembly protein FimV n=1 Tax=Acinetobacter variabilis TaxID=70346 RepID=UPI0021D24BD8